MCLLGVDIFNVCFTPWGFVSGSWYSGSTAMATNIFLLYFVVYIKRCTIANLFSTGVILSTVADRLCEEH
jgi:hypothetical protein